MSTSPPPSSCATSSALPPRGQQPEAMCLIKRKQAPGPIAAMWRGSTHVWTPQASDSEAGPQGVGVVSPGPRPWGACTCQLSRGLQLHRGPWSDEGPPVPLNPLSGGQENGWVGCPLPQTTQPLACPVSVWSRLPLDNQWSRPASLALRTRALECRV